ncbi:hemolysin family protein [Naumannella halotolerans]|uniref:CBS domain containing-hemolysin-like protein n=1 Tax=Naumannella halotolerans TaxID=993414 RepID=A0A4R7J2G5_9ACTN|nr:hemolysin family protein [Naumannella halotolerans]TDT31391.1 CBS domain containing-hemolysin-like protein [Naumannella halotolerans]
MTWILLAIALLLVLLCGIFVAAEFSFVTVDRTQVRREAEAGDTAAQGLDKALTHLSTQLSGAQIGITLTNLAIGFLAEPAIAQLLHTPITALGVPEQAVSPISLVVALILANVVTMVYGELVPKNLSIANPMRVAKLTQLPMRVMTAVLFVPIKICNNAANAIVRLLGFEPQEELRSVRSADEIASLVRRSAHQGMLDADTATLVERSIAFADRTAGDIMTPRVRVRMVAADDPVQAVIDASRRTGHSRFPVSGSGEDADEVVGMVHLRDVVGVPVDRRASVPVSELMRRTVMVPETLQLDPLLTQLREEGMQVVVVVDEYGGTAGLVTLEDVVEELVGEIADEHDTARAQLRHRRDGSWTLSGLLRPDEVEEQTHIALPEGEHYDTVAGLFVTEFGSIPQVGDEIRIAVAREIDLDDDGPNELGEYQVLLRVERMDGRRVDRLRMEVLDDLVDAGPAVAKEAAR